MKNKETLPEGLYWIKNDGKNPEMILNNEQAEELLKSVDYLKTLDLNEINLKKIKVSNLDELKLKSFNEDINDIEKATKDSACTISNNLKSIMERIK